MVCAYMCVSISVHVRVCVCVCVCVCEGVKENHLLILFYSLG